MPVESNTSLLALLPEVVLLVGLLGLFALTLPRGRERLALAWSGLVALLFVLAVLFTFGRTGVFFGGAYRVDGFSQVIKLVLGLGYGGCLVICRQLGDIRREVRPEYFFLLAASVTGMVFLVGSIDLIVLVVALELSSFPVFLLIAMRREENGQRMQMEGAIKYMMFGVGASGLMLFGMSYLFGLTGTTSIPLMAERLGDVTQNPLALLGLLLSLAAFLYKLAIFPFHFWTPDVYEGASHETTAILASLPKVAALAVLLRLVSLSDGAGWLLAAVVGLLAVGSMFYGNLVALWQSDFKRLLGFSAIAHGGYTLVGVAALGAGGYAAALYYMSGYVFAVLACFLVIARVSVDGRNLGIRDLAGLHRRSPLLALTLIVAIFSLAGIPPMVGFMGKFALLLAAWEAGLSWLVFFALLNTVIAAYYYLSVVKTAFFGETSEALASAPLPLDRRTRITCVLIVAALLFLGLFPSVWIETLQAVF